MASSHMMASASSATLNIMRQSSFYSIKSLTSMNFDDMFCMIESDGVGDATSPISRQGSISKVEWAEVSNDNNGGGGSAGGGEMMLEDFLERAEMDDGIRILLRGRGRKRVGVSSGSLDLFEKAALQRKERMIKNRESAVRSRERKQVK